MANILIIDKDEMLRNVLSVSLKEAGHEVATASENDALKLIRSNIYEIVIAHIETLKPSNVDLIKSIKDTIPDAETIVMSDYDATEEAVKSMKLGAWGYVVKPVSLRQVVIAVNRALEERELAINIRNLQKQVLEKYRFENIVTGNAEMLHIRKLANEAARGDSPVLITGERGTGKHLIGMSIHTNSPRRREPLIYVDLPAVDTEKIESTLFGAISGFASQTTRNIRGAIERADRGTIFLREITAIHAAIQEKLLEFLDYNTLSRAGSDEVIYSEARLIATSAANVEEYVRHGKLQKDLFDRLKAVWMHLPPLRERKDDIQPLTDHFISIYSRRSGKQISHVSDEATLLLTLYDWPGNIRELEEAIEYAVALTTDRMITTQSLPYSIRFFGMVHG